MGLRPRRVCRRLPLGPYQPPRGTSHRLDLGELRTRRLRTRPCPGPVTGDRALSRTLHVGTGHQERIRGGTRWRILPLPWRPSPTPHRRPSPNGSGRRGRSVPSTTLACIRLRRKGGSPGGARASAASTFVQLWASWTHSYARAAPTANGDTRTRDDPAGCCCGGGEAGGAGRGPLRAFVRRAVTAQRPCGIPAAVRPLSAAGGAVGHDSGAPGFRPRRCRAVVSPRGSPPGQWSLLTAVFVVVRKAVSGAFLRSPIWPQRTRVTVRPSRPTEKRWMSEMPICGSVVSRL